MAKRVSLLWRGRRAFRVARRGTNAALEASSVFARSLVFGRAEPSGRDQYVQNVPARSAVLAGLVAGAGTVLVLLVDLSRLYLGLHYPADILAGLLAAPLP